jgi:hypothetical protein
MGVDVNLKGNLEKFYKQVEGGIGKLITGARVDSAVIFNNTDQPVTFYVYNYIDSVYWISAMKTLVAPGAYAIVAASGAFFKIHPNDHKTEEFLVAPFNAYIYGGPGSVEKVEAKS